MNELPIALSVLTVAVTLPFAVLYGRRLHRRGVTLSGNMRPRDAPAILVCIAAFAAALVAANSMAWWPSAAWHIPLVIEYHLIAAMWAAKLSLVTFVFGSTATVAILSGHRARYGFVIIAGAMVVSLDAGLRHINQPSLPPLKERVEGEIVFQSHQSTCAPASAAMIAREFGFEWGESEMADLLNTTRDGTTPAQIVYGMRRLGFEARKKTSSNRDPAEIDPPAILFIDFRGAPDGHAVAYMGPVGDKFEVLDPNLGRREMSMNDMRKYWRGHAIEIRRGATQAR